MTANSANPEEDTHMDDLASKTIDLQHRLADAARKLEALSAQQANSTSLIRQLQSDVEAALAQVESRMGAVAWGLRPALRFPSPLIEPDVPISGIRLSDWLHRKVHGVTLMAGVPGTARRAPNAALRMGTGYCRALPLCAA